MTNETQTPTNTNTQDITVVRDSSIPVSYITTPVQDATPAYELLDLKVYLDTDGRCSPQIREYIGIINGLIMKKTDVIENKRNTDINIINDDIECFMRHLIRLVELQDVI